ncbi:hypothetical protein FSP39_015757 [Pinctada imbricata]|uniref:C2H2-type domain-containing protein n=1 Tax=Pinctada imbricata TaxID=66713 RepID=A0AA88YRH3_PINIB|nr:hypothetical protein FSP39_015757 [Pinctada imbricata]
MDVTMGFTSRTRQFVREISATTIKRICAHKKSSTGRKERQTDRQTDRQMLDKGRSHKPDWSFTSPDENKETTVHNNNKAKKVKLRENKPSTKVTKRSRGRPHKHPIHNNETSTIAKDEESYENDTSFTSGNVKPSIHSLMCIDGDAFKSRIETNENIQTLNPEKTDEIECRANQTECGTKKTEYDAPKRKCGANKRTFRTKKICGAKKRKCVPKKIHFVECAVEKREFGFEKIECGAKNIECGLEKIEYGAKNIECGFEKIEYGIEETECDEDSGLHTAEETECDEDSGLHTFLDNSFEEECELILPTCSPDLPIRDNIEGEAGVKPTAHLDQVNDITPKFDGNDVRIGTVDQIQSIENSKILETGKNNSESKLKKTLLPKITESWEFQCRICFHVFSSKHALKCHNKIHLPGYQKPKEKCEKKGQKFECSECDREFSSEGRLKRHIKLKPHEPVKCDSCDIIFPNREKYKIHVNNCHLEKDVTYQCEDCGKVFKKKGTLRKHQNFIHKNIHAYTCTICNLQFKYCKSFKAHTRIYHSAGDSPKVVCDICGGQFTTDQNLQRHMKIHNNDMKFACPHCPKTFVQKHGLTCHLRIHTGSKPYSCDICKEGFAHNVSLKNHRRKYHMNVPVIFPEKTEDLSYQE